MRQFNPTGGIDRKRFDILFKAVFPRIYPSLKVSDKDIEKDGKLKNALAAMRIEHHAAYERQHQTNEMNRSFLRNRRKGAAQRALGVNLGRLSGESLGNSSWKFEQDNQAELAEIYAIN